MEIGDVDSVVLLAYRRCYQCDLKASFAVGYIQYKGKLSEQQEASFIFLWSIPTYLNFYFYVVIFVY